MEKVYVIMQHVRFPGDKEMSEPIGVSLTKEDADKYLSKLRDYSNSMFTRYDYELVDVL